MAPFQKFVVVVILFDFIMVTKVPLTYIQLTLFFLAQVPYRCDLLEAGALPRLFSRSGTQVGC